MTDQKAIGSQLLETPKKNGSNGKNGKTILGEDSLYFKVAVPKSIVKRDGRMVPFDDQLIHNALGRCFASLGQQPKTSIDEITQQVVNVVAAKYDLPTVEGVQDIVEMVLQAAGEYEAAKHYILYRAERAKMRAKRPVPAEVRDAFADSDKYFPTQLQKFQFYDKYSRFNYELGRRETWVETVNRAVDYLRELSDYRLPKEIYERIRKGILDMKVMPSMRLLAMAGPAARRNNIAIYNCSYLPVDSIDSFVEALIISMSGCGVGFSVERQYVEQFPRIARQTGKPAPTFVVPDTSEGWADAVRVGLTAWFNGEDVMFDYSQVRPAGEPLRVKGGRASGPEPLRQMLDFARTRILSRQGSFLRTLDAHDIMCAVGNAAVSGGVRRTAMISLFDYDDVEMRHCKDGDFWRNNSQRWNANNSAVWPSRELTQAEITRFVLDMVESGRGEPGIFNRRAAVDNRPERRLAAEFGTNPCVTADTWVLTQEGPRQVWQLAGKPFVALVDGRGHASTDAGFFYTGHKPVYLLKTADGHTVRATADHPILQVTGQEGDVLQTVWRPLGELKAGDAVRLHHHPTAVWGAADEEETAVAWLLGLLVGQGTFAQRGQKWQALLQFKGQNSQIMAEMAHAVLAANHHNHTAVAQPMAQPNDLGWQLAADGLTAVAQKYGITPHQHTITPAIEQSSSAFHAAFLRALFDADGTVRTATGEAVCIRLAATSLDFCQASQRMLLRLGINSHIQVMSETQYVLCLSQANAGRFQQRIGFSDPTKAMQLSELLTHVPATAVESFVATIEAITLVGHEDVYDCTVPGVHAFDANGVYVHNCGEIILRPYQFCNLTSAIARTDDTYETLRDKVELATIIGTIQSMATMFPGLRPQWQKNCEEERLLGVDLNGQMDSVVVQDPAVQRKLREVAVETNRIYAEALGISRSVSITCVKPSGNSSQLVDSASGLHARWAPYYIRNVRVGTHTPVFKVLQDTAVPMDPENGQVPETAVTWVIHFPVKAPDGAITRNDRSAIEQCEYWLQNKLNYTEHNPSVTITYQPNEVLDIIHWVWKHQDKIGGMAFLPAFDAQYDQMPYMEIDEETYKQLAAKFPTVDFSKIYRYEEEDLTTAAQELACLAGECDI